MTDDSCAQEAAAAVSGKAARLALAAASGVRGADELQRQADVLRRIAPLIASGAHSLRAALEADAVPGLIPDDRRIAGTEVWSLAMLRESHGKIGEVGVALPEGWENGDGPFETPIHRPTLREAVELFDIACVLHDEAYWTYTKGLLLMRMHEYREAIGVFDGLTTGYAEAGAQMAGQCRRKLAGGYDARAEVAAAFDEQMKQFEQRGIDADHLQYAKDVLFGALAEADSTPPEERKVVAPMDRDAIDQSNRAAAAAQQFAEHLAYGNFDAAQALLARNLATTDANELREAYQRMICLEDDEDAGQVEICVMSSELDMPRMTSNDLGWVYVAISAFMFNEAVSVIVTLENGEAKIRDIEWGRP